MKYIYTVTNVGPTTENIYSLSRTFNVNFEALMSALDTIKLVLEDYVAITKVLSIDICEEVTIFSVSDEVDATSSSCVICEDTTEYEFVVERICIVEVEIKCVLADVINTDCRLISPAEDLEYLDVAVEYSYIVTNISPTPLYC